MQIDALVGDITTQVVAAVVNAANNALAPGSGVNGAIHRAAGYDALQEACRALGGCATGDAKATPGFRLAATWIIHTVGPVWRGGTSGESALLASCYRRCLEVADELDARSVAFPAISTGVFGYPPHEAAATAIGSIRSTTTRVERVVLVAFDAATLERYQMLLAED